MGHVRVRAIFYNATDYAEWMSGELPEASVTKLGVDALVDTGATYPALPEDMIKELGLVFLREVNGEVAEGQVKLKLHGLAILQIEDRIAGCPVIKRLKAKTPVVGVIALEQMGFKIDPVTGRLIKGLPLML